MAPCLGRSALNLTAIRRENFARTPTAVGLFPSKRSMVPCLGHSALSLTAVRRTSPCLRSQQSYNGCWASDPERSFFLPNSPPCWAPQDAESRCCAERDDMQDQKDSDEGKEEEHCFALRACTTFSSARGSVKVILRRKRMQLRSDATATIRRRSFSFFRPARPPTPVS